jgi:hypothetical protein
MRLLSFLLTIALLSTTTLLAQKAPLRRSDAFLGFHFDFHASRWDTVGGSIRPGMLDSFLLATRPDYVQVDSKGHPGVVSYPSKYGTQVAFFKKDALRMWREATLRQGVPLFVHYSGVWDDAALAVHPNWAIMNAKGEKSTSKTAFWSAYLDSLMIPQLRELAEVYKIDGVWVDGDCWAVEADYSPQGIAAFQQATGIKTVPKSAEDPDFLPFIEFQRSQFKKHVQRYVDAVHQTHPNFQITSNWAYSSMMPEPITLKLDFLSGDLSPNNSVYSAAFQARCLALQGKPWDLMAWSFSRSWDKAKEGVHTDKSLVQLQQEAAEVIAMGGGYQSYWTQNEDASIRPYTFQRMGELAKFCRARQAFSHKNKIVPQVGILYSTSAWKKTKTSVYGDGGTQNMQGILYLLLDGQHPSEILMEHHLDGRMDQYGLLVVPEWTGIDEAVKEKLLAYTRKGGNLMIIGGKAVKDFEKELGVTFIGEPKELGHYQNYFGYGPSKAGMKGWFQEVQLAAGQASLGSISKSWDFGRNPMPFSSISSYGQGKIIGIYHDLGQTYNQYRAEPLRKIMIDLVDQVFPKQALEISGSSLVHTILSEKDGKTVIHLINTGGQHANPNNFSYEELPPLHNISLRYRPAKMPKRITWQPSKQVLPFKVEQDGRILVKIPSLEVHGALVIE